VGIKGFPHFLEKHRYKDGLFKTENNRLIADAYTKEIEYIGTGGSQALGNEVKPDVFLVKNPGNDIRLAPVGDKKDQFQHRRAFFGLAGLFLPIGMSENRQLEGELKVPPGCFSFSHWQAPRKP
jgi:hypothetical protein